MSEEKIHCFKNENKKLSLESVKERNAGDNLNQEELSEKTSVERPVEMLIERSVDMSVDILEEMAKKMANNENEEGFSDSITLDGRGEQILKYKVNSYAENDAENNLQNGSPNSSRNVLKNLRTESVLNYFKNDSSLSLNSERIMEDYLTRIVDGLFLFRPSKPTFTYNFSYEIK